MNFESFSKRTLTRTPDLTAFIEPYFFFTLDTVGKILFVSASVDRILVTTPNALIGQLWESVFNESTDLEQHESSPHKKFNAQMQTSGGIVNLEVQTYDEVDNHGRLVATHGLARQVDDDTTLESTVRRKLADLEVLAAELSPRENQVLSRVLEGRLNKSIAKELEISERAVERIRARIMKKFGADSTAKMISMGTELNLLQELLGHKKRSVVSDETASAAGEPISEIVQN